MSPQRDMPEFDAEEYWNEVAGPKWVENRPKLDGLMAPITSALLEAVSARAGERVLDVGCGAGTTTLAFADKVGESGFALGIDVSRSLLSEARLRAGTAANIAFTCADAQTHVFEPPAFDVVTSRFGIMFFQDSQAAFSNLRAAMRPGGRLVFACWQAPDANPWATFAVRAAAPFLPEWEPPDPDAPGPFRFSEDNKLSALLKRSGFSEIEVTSRSPELAVTGSVPEIVDFFSQVGPLSRAIRELNDDTRTQAIAAVAEAVQKGHDGQQIALPSAVWLVSARHAA